MIPVMGESGKGNLIGFKGYLMLAREEMDRINRISQD
jgi:hypothetical protein